MPREKFFGVAPNELKWGIAPGEHVCHLFVAGTPNMVEVPYDGNLPETSGYNGVEQKEMYNNPADNATAKYFMELAKMVEKDYNSDLCEGESGKGYIEILESIKEYIFANSRHTQQEALAKLNKKIKKYKEELETQNKNDSEELNEDERINDSLKGLQEYTNILNQKTKGSLVVPPEHMKDKNKRKPAEPDNTIMGKMAVWISTDQELFPHDPSPNDIKQGYGVEDCFMLSAVAVKAAQDPQYIRDMMKDNGDGTVTVRFYDLNQQPVYIDVQKSVNKSLVGSNVYASGSLWVQMLEKAYVQYVTLTNEQKIKGWPSGSKNKTAKGYKAIDRGSSSNFLNAFDGKSKYGGGGILPTCNPDFGPIYSFDDNGVRDFPVDRERYGYLKYEEELFKFYDEHINKEKEVITVGTSEGGLVGISSQEASFLKTHGIRTGHAYGILKVFEQEVNGKLKKFVQLRDPYATFKAQYNNKGMLEKNGSGLTPGGATMLEGISKGGLNEMGTFNLEFADFLTYFKSFSAIKESTAQKMQELISKSEAVRDESGRVRFNSIYNHREEFTKDALDKTVPYSKEEEAEELAKLSDEEKTIYERLTNDPKKLTSGLQNLKKELQCTDEFFTWPNSDAFNNMRNACYQLNKDMEKGGKFIGASLKTKINMVKKFTQLGSLADEYQKKKTEDLKKAQAAGKSPSTRFIHRLTAAMNIRNLCDGSEMMKTWPNKNFEGMGIMMNDISTKIERANNKEIVLKSEDEVTRMKDVVSIIETELKKHPEYAKAADIDPKSVESTKRKCDDFEIVEIDIPEAESNTKKTEEKKKSNDLDGFNVIEVEDLVNQMNM